MYSKVKKYKAWVGFFDKPVRVAKLISLLKNRLRLRFISILFPLWERYPIKSLNTLSTKIFTLYLFFVFLTFIMVQENPMHISCLKQKKIRKSHYSGNSWLTVWRLKSKKQKQKKRWSKQQQIFFTQQTTHNNNKHFLHKTIGNQGDKL